MHEFSLARATKDTIVNKYNGLHKFIIYIGQIQQIDIELFKEAMFEEIREFNIEVYFEEIPAKMKCNACQHEFIYDKTSLNSEEQENIHFLPEMIYIYIRCPNCKSNDFSIVEGRGIFIKPL
ncbi:MAG: hydrogenase/urease maturation nickel metallochaperone HypA [Candidatus Calescibacterium sp.]|nr:hydrogenase/urease maturation nickel metallochaperone HypA [Candidatus Calescibacterium sp.]